MTELTREKIKLFKNVGLNNNGISIGGIILDEFCDLALKGLENRNVDLDMKLTCDIKLPPVTTIMAGCSLRTLLVGLQARGMQPYTAESLEAEKLQKSYDALLDCNVKMQSELGSLGLENEQWKKEAQKLTEQRDALLVVLKNSLRDIENHAEVRDLPWLLDDVAEYVRDAIAAVEGK